MKKKMRAKTKGTIIVLLLILLGVVAALVYNAVWNGPISLDKAEFTANAVVQVDGSIRAMRSLEDILTEAQSEYGSEFLIVSKNYVIDIFESGGRLYGVVYENEGTVEKYKLGDERENKSDELREYLVQRRRESRREEEG